MSLLQKVCSKLLKPTARLNDKNLCAAFGNLAVSVGEVHPFADDMGVVKRLWLFIFESCCTVQSRPQGTLSTGEGCG
eukprot:1474098-Amphidinium_carterae.1